MIKIIYIYKLYTHNFLNRLWENMISGSVLKDNSLINVLSNFEKSYGNCCNVQW